MQYLAIALIAAMALGQWGMSAYRMVRGMVLHGDRGIRAPFSLSGGVITGMNPLAHRAGLQAGDRIVSINGHPVTGEAVLQQEFARSHIGDVMTVEVQHADGNSQTVKWQLSIPQQRRGGRNRAGGIFGPILLVIVLPLAFLLVAIWVVAAKPRDISAWLVLGILPYFEALLAPGSTQWDWTTWYGPYWNNIAQLSMPFCLMWFGVLFPERASLDRRVPWLKWLLGLPLVAMLLFDLLHTYARYWNISLARSMAPWTRATNNLESAFSVLCVLYFFILFSHKIFKEKVGADAGRRLRLLFWGALIGLLPFGAMVVYTLVTGDDFSEAFPQWLSFGMVFVLAIFPLSLAYALVVQRAMDVRILLRQGTKYAFARYTLYVVRALIVAFFSWRLSLFISYPASYRRAVDYVWIAALTVLFFAFRFVLSKKLEQDIDRRFFREAYSAEQVLSELSEEARNFTETGPLLDTITQRISDTLHIERMAVFLRSGETFRLQTATGVDLTSPVLLPAGSATVKTLSTARRSTALRIDDSSHWLMEATDVERAALSEFHTELLVPLPGRGRLIGVMALGPKRSEEPYSRTDRRLLEAVASQTGLALENAELLKSLAKEAAQRERVTRDIEIAREVQERLFPQSYPTFDGVDIAGYCRPAQEIGGDYYDVMEVFRPSPDGGEPRRMLGLAIGDVSGKGISAALLMASLRASLRGMTLVGSSNLGQLMRHVNQLVYEGSTANRYATFFYAEYDPATRRLCYANGGHNPPVILRGEQVLSLEVTGTVIGLMEDTGYEQRDIQLEPGDVMLLFTDGISEAMDRRNEEWGEMRMTAAAQRERARGAMTAEGLLRAIFRRADEFAGAAPQHDDMTLMVLRVS